MVIALIAFIITLLLVVGIHEAGHALVARVFKVKIQRISIGFGKPLLTWRSRSAEWVWALWPLGGYVRLLDSRLQKVTAQDHTYCFDKQPTYVRVLIIIAGACANFIAAQLLFGLLFFLGYQQTPALIQSVIPHSMAAAAGFKANERIIAVAGQNTHSWDEVSMAFMSALQKKKLPVLVQKSDKTQQERILDVSRWSWQSGGLLPAIGLKPNLSETNSYAVKGLPFWQAQAAALTKCGQLLSFFLLLMKQLVTGIIPFSILLGPFGLLAASIGSFVQGPMVFCYFIGLLSLAVGLVNLLPIPGLDGGLLVYALVEKIRGKPLSLALELLLYRLALIVFGILLVQLIVNDVSSSLLLREAIQGSSYVR
jgi:regulator of sigma E protease